MRNLQIISLTTTGTVTPSPTFTYYSFKPTVSNSYTPTVTASVSVSNSASNSASNSVSNIVSNSVCNTVSYSRLPSLMTQTSAYSAFNTPSVRSTYLPLAPTLVSNPDDSVTFPKIYFLYTGLPFALLLICLLGYVYDMRVKYKRMKKSSSLPITVVPNRTALNSIPPFNY